MKLKILRVIAVVFAVLGLLMLVAAAVIYSRSVGVPHDAVGGLYHFTSGLRVMLHGFVGGVSLGVGALLGAIAVIVGRRKK